MRSWALRVSFAFVLTFASALAATAPAAAEPQPGSCAEIMPLDRVSKGMTATGWTVSEGTRARPFGVRVLGKLADGIAPGRDMIVAELDSPEITAAGGIWSGMSGSPVVANSNGKLIGALAFSLSAGPSKIAGLTPAQDVLDVLAYGGRSASSSALPARVALPLSMRRTIARSTGAASEDVGASLVRLKVPVSVSGLNSRAMDRVRRLVARENLPWIPYAGSSAPAGTTTTSAAVPEPGESFAAVISRGAVTLAGVGTTTYTCSGQVLGFGHQFNFTGETTMAAYTADTLAIVNDPFVGPFKLAAPDSIFGRIDQDRLAALRAFGGETPSATSVSALVRATDSGREREASSEVFLPDFTPTVASMNLVATIDSTYDALGPGSAEMSWTISGTRADGRGWTLSRSNLYASRLDISVDSSLELLHQLELIASNPFEEVDVTSVRASTAVERAVEEYTLSRVLVKVGRRYLRRQTVRAFPGQRLHLRALLKPAGTRLRKTVDLTVRIPRRARRNGFVEISGAPPLPLLCESEEAPIEGEECEGLESGLESFDQLLALLQKQRRNDVLVAELRLGAANRVRSRDKEVQDKVVRGSRLIFVELPGGGGSPGGQQVFEATLAFGRGT